MPEAVAEVVCSDSSTWQPTRPRHLFNTFLFKQYATKMNIPCSGAVMVKSTVKISNTTIVALAVNKEVKKPNAHERPTVTKIEINTRNSFEFSLDFCSV